jgi:hypothetical protein
VREREKEGEEERGRERKRERESEYLLLGFCTPVTKPYKFFVLGGFFVCHVIATHVGTLLTSMKPSCKLMNV